MSAATPANPLLATWSTPFELPPFADIKPEHYRPAFEQALSDHRQESDRTGGAISEPTFENTIVPLENSGRALDRVSSVFWNLTGAHTSDALQEIEREMSPRLAQHWNAITSNAALFARIDAVMQKPASHDLSPEQLRVIERTHLSFVRAGAKLGAEDKKSMGEIVERLAALGKPFSQNVLGDEKSYA